MCVVVILGVDVYDVCGCELAMRGMVQRGLVARYGVGSACSVVRVAGNVISACVSVPAVRRSYVWRWVDVVVDHETAEVLVSRSDVDVMGVIVGEVVGAVVDTEILGVGSLV